MFWATSNKITYVCKDGLELHFQHDLIGQLLKFNVSNMFSIEKCI